MMKPAVAVALHHRDHFSRGNARRTFQYAGYHWSVVIMPPATQGANYDVFDATDTSDIDPATFRLTNPSMDWWLRIRKDINPASEAKLIGRLVVGQIADGVSSAELEAYFRGVPLPVKNTHPQQSCVTWAVDAVKGLQERDWLRAFDVGAFQDAALRYADERMKGEESSEPSVKYYQV